MNNFRSWTTALGYFLLVLLPLPCLADSAITTEKVRVGVILGLTGPMASAAAEMRKGIELAVEEPGSPALEIFYEDDKGMELKEAVNGAQRLVNDKKVHVLLSWVNTTIPAIAPIVNRSKVPLIEFWDSNRSMLSMGPYIFCSGASTELAGEKAGKFATTTRGLKRIGVIVANDPWSELIAEHFTKAVESHGGRIIRTEKVDLETNDVRSVIMRLKQEQADGIYAPLCGTSLHATIKQGRDLGFKGDIITADCTLESDLATLGLLAEGTFSTQMIISDPNFTNRYTGKFGANSSAPSLGYAGLAYDAIRIVQHVVTAIKSRDEPVTSERIREALNTMIYNGVSGKAVLRGISEKEETVVVVRNGRFEPYQ